MKAIIIMTDDKYINIPADTFDIDGLNECLFVYADKKLVGIFKLEHIKEAHLSEKGGVENG